METLKNLNYLYEKFNHLTEGSYHDTLWQLMINGARKGFDSAFVYVPVPTNNGTNVGIVDRHESGYTPLLFSIKKNAPEKRRKEMIDELNKVIFDLTPKEAMHIEMSSYSQRNVEKLIEELDDDRNFIGED